MEESRLTTLEDLAVSCPKMEIEDEYKVFERADAVSPINLIENREQKYISAKALLDETGKWNRLYGKERGLAIAIARTMGVAHFRGVFLHRNEKPNRSDQAIITPITDSKRYR